MCAARVGAHTTSLDLSKKYLEWGKRNFTLNGLDPAAHDFIYGDTFDWLRRLAKKGRVFDAVVLDPPTFSQSKEHGTFRAEKITGNSLPPRCRPSNRAESSSPRPTPRSGRRKNLWRSWNPPWARRNVMLCGALRTPSPRIFP